MTIEAAVDSVVMFLHPIDLRQAENLIGKIAQGVHAEIEYTPSHRKIADGFETREIETQISGTISLKSNPLVSSKFSMKHSDAKRYEFLELDFQKGYEEPFASEIRKMQTGIKTVVEDFFRYK